MTNKRMGFLTILLLALNAGAQTPKKTVPAYAQLMIKKPPTSLELDSFYKKYTDAMGIPIVSSQKVPDVALLVARDIVNYMLVKRPDIRQHMIEQKSRVMIMAQTEFEMDLPERKDMKKPEKDDQRLTDDEREDYDKPGGIGSMTDEQYWNQRARGMGGNEVSCAEENILGYKSDGYYGENILVHEFSHNIFDVIHEVDPELYEAVEKAYESAKSKGLYKDQYAINTIDEYWAEGTQWWFWTNFEFYDGKKRVQTPNDLKAYDPVLYGLLEKVYSGHRIPADVYSGKNLKPGQ